MRDLKLALPATMVAVLIPFAASAGQSETSSYVYAHIRHVEGEVLLQRAAESDPSEAGINLPVTNGDRVWTRPQSRVEIEMRDGSLLRMDERTKVDFVEFGQGQRETLIRLWSGSVILRSDTEDATTFRVDTPSGSVYPASMGLVRIDVDEAEQSTMVSVFEGVAELASEGGSVLLRSGQRSLVELGGRPEPSYEFNTARLDDFDAWSGERDLRYARTERIHGVPSEVEVYVDDLYDHGTWRTDVDLGPVWYPTVSAGWYPYNYGYWSYTLFGWTWISYEPWGWAPYHYGRWGYNHWGWHWIPGSYWGPAWVSWAVGPNWVGWCPLGYYDRPVHHWNTVFHRGGHAVPRGTRAALPGQAVDGWSFMDAKGLDTRSPGKARLRTDDVRATAHEARLLESGAILDRNLEPRVVGAAAMTRASQGGIANIKRGVGSSDLSQGRAMATRRELSGGQMTGSPSAVEQPEGASLRRSRVDRSEEGSVSSPTQPSSIFSQRRRVESAGATTRGSSPSPLVEASRKRGRIVRSGEPIGSSGEAQESRAPSSNVIRRSTAPLTGTPTSGARSRQSLEGQNRSESRVSPGSLSLGRQRSGSSGPDEPDSPPPGALYRSERPSRTEGSTWLGSTRRTEPSSRSSGFSSNTQNVREPSSRQPSSGSRDFFSRRSPGRSQSAGAPRAPSSSLRQPSGAAPPASSGSASGSARSTRSRSSKPKN